MKSTVTVYENNEVKEYAKEEWYGVPEFVTGEIVEDDDDYYGLKWDGEFVNDSPF